MVTGLLMSWYLKTGTAVTNTLISMAVLCLVSQCHCTYSFSISLNFSQTSDKHDINLDRFTNPTNHCTRFAFVGLVISNTVL